MNDRKCFFRLMPLLLASVLVSATVYGQANGMIDNRTVDGARQLFEQRSAGFAEKRDADISALNEKYTKSLESAADQAQKAGQLETLLALRNELKRFERNESVPAAVNGNRDPALSKWYEAYHQQHDAIMADYKATMSNLTGSYLDHLAVMKQELTKAGDVKEALAFMKEYERVKNGAVPAPTSVVDNSEPSEEDPQGLADAKPLELLKIVGLDRRVVSFDGSGSERFTGPRTTELQATHEGRNQVDGDAIQLRGGRTLIDGVDDLLLAACKASQALTITAELTPMRPNQTGPARIISFSLDGQRRNFSLCQEGNALILRLRTTDTGVNGTDPQVTLYTFKHRDREKRNRRDREARERWEPETHKIAVTYRPGELRFFLDGERVDVAGITGKFDNWEPCHFVLGNEWEGDRSWMGTLHQFAVYARFMPDLEGVLKTRQ